MVKSENSMILTPQRCSNKSNQMSKISFSLKKYAYSAFIIMTCMTVCYLPVKAQKVMLWPEHVGLNSWFNQVPVDQSESIRAIGFTGKYAKYTNADTWYPTWSSDGNLYSPWTDGSIEDEQCKSYEKEKAHTGQAKIVGDDPMNLKVTSLGTTLGSALPYQGRYPAGSLVYNDIWYYGTYCLLEDPSSSMNWPILGPFVGFRISRDKGKTWEESPVSPTNNLFNEHTDLSAKPIKIGVPHFVDFGQNMQYSPDGYAYMTCHSASIDDPKPRQGNLSWISGDFIHLIRVKPSPENMNDPSKYEFYAGKGEDGEDIWSKNLEDIKPIFEWNNKAGSVTITYNAPLKKYIMCITDGWPTVQSMDTYLLESDSMTGPWKIISYLKDFGPQAYFVNIPSKFISNDGKTAWLCYSANFLYDRDDVKFKGNPEGSNYQLCLQEIKFLGEKEYQEIKGE